MPFGPLMDAHCVGTGVPVGSDGPATESARFRPASSTPKRHASSFVNRPAARRKEGFHLCVRARAHARSREFTERKRAVSFILCFAPEVLSSDLSPRFYIRRYFARINATVPNYVVHKPAGMTSDETHEFMISPPCIERGNRLFHTYHELSREL